MIRFKQVQPDILNLQTGQLTKINPVISQPQRTIFHDEIDNLISKGISNDKILKAIDSHPEIIDKESLKNYLIEKTTKI